MTCGPNRSLVDPMLAGPQARINGNTRASVRRDPGDRASFVVASDVANLIDIPYRYGMLGLTTQTTLATQTTGSCPLQKRGMALRLQN